MVGKAAVEAAARGVSGMMVTLEREARDGKYSCTTGLVELEKVANGEKKVPPEFIDPSGVAITDAFRSYALPLIQGEAQIEIGRDGLPIYARLKKELVKEKTKKA